MKTSCNYFLLAAALLLTVPARAAEAPPARPALAIVVVENLREHYGALTDFDRLDLAFQEVARERKWPVAVAAERFAANTAEHETELRIFNQPLREVTLGDLTFRGWMTLTVQGVKHDFGIVTFTYFRRPGESTDDALEKVFRGAARAAADRIEPILFSKPATEKTISENVEFAGFSVTVPDKGWRQIRLADGVSFERPVAHYINYRASLSVVQIPRISDRAKFIEYVKLLVKKDGDTSTYARVADDFKEQDREGLWLVECHHYLYSWHVPVEPLGPGMRSVALFAMDPADREKLIVVSYVWRGNHFNETSFDEDAARFLASFRKAKP